MMKRKRIVIPALLLCAAMLLTACGADGQASSLNVYFTAPYLNEEAITEVTGKISEAFPHLNTEDAQISYQTIITGDPNTDPMGFTAGTTAMVGAIASQDLDILICDMATAKRYRADESYYKLADLFTQEEIDSFTLPIVQLDVTDEDGNPTGEVYDACGVDVSSLEGMDKVCSDQMVMMIAVNTPNLEAAKEVFYAIATYQ